METVKDYEVDDIIKSCFQYEEEFHVTVYRKGIADETCHNSLEAKIKAAMTKDDQIILGSLHLNDRLSWESYAKSVADCRDVFRGLVEAKLYAEAQVFYRVMADCLGDFTKPNSFLGENRKA